MLERVVISEECHVINALPPIDINGQGNTGDVFNMANFSHASIIIQGGVSGGAVATVTLKECTSKAGGGVAIPFNYYACTTAFGSADGDVLGAKTALTATTGFAMSTTDGIFYIIELDGSQLSDGYNWVEVCFSNPGASQIASCVVILSGARYGNAQSPTAVSN
jgi:hypothetical protein